MSYGLCYHNPAKPTMDEIEVVERDVEESDQGVVATCHDHQRDHVDDGKGAGTVSKMVQESCLVSAPLYVVDTENNVHHNDPSQEKALRPGW